MGDINMPESVPCQFDAKGWAPCKKPSDNGWCSKHEGMKCSSCDKQAVISCDAQMGGLACGAPLCETCEHDYKQGNHITKDVADEKRRKDMEEGEARKASRDNPEQRMDEDLGVPLTLLELLKADYKEQGFELIKVYLLELKHGLMGFFPAIFDSDDERIVFATDLNLLEQVWQEIEPKEATLIESLAYVNSEKNIAYVNTDNDWEQERRRPVRLITEIEFKKLVNNEETPFRWARGLFGGGSFSKERFCQLLVDQAKKKDHISESKFA